jgi:hypothetical protein
MSGLRGKVRVCERREGKIKNWHVLCYNHFHSQTTGIDQNLQILSVNTSANFWSRLKLQIFAFAELQILV